MLISMLRIQVEVRDENEDPLRDLAFRSHRSVREQASYLLNLKLAEVARLAGAEPEPIADVA